MFVFAELSWRRWLCVKKPRRGTAVDKKMTGGRRGRERGARGRARCVWWPRCALLGCAPSFFFVFRCDGAGEHRQAPQFPLLPRTLARVGIAQQGDVHPRRQLTLPARLDRAARRDLLKPWKGREAEASSVGHRQVPNRTYSNASSLALLWKPSPRLAPHSCCRSWSLQCCRRSPPPRLPPRAGG